ncbi:MAG: AtpZ/AtpI family protein [Roseburia sp.]|nr:AtpZ/AtpI family protein [Roseburia sp.]MCM1099189.1 AtpZ/AtpI family protein [Ruminococcus flavefaciens]
MRPRKDDKKKTFQTLTLITQLGLIMITAIGMTTALGVWLDHKLGTSFLTVILFFVGAVGGAQAAYRTINQIFGDDDGKDDKTSEKDG